MSGNHTHYISTFQELNEIRADPQQKIKNYHILSNNLVKVTTQAVLCNTPPFNKGTFYGCADYGGVQAKSDHGDEAV